MKIIDLGSGKIRAIIASEFVASVDGEWQDKGKRCAEARKSCKEQRVHYMCDIRAGDEWDIVRGSGVRPNTVHCPP